MFVGILASLLLLCWIGMPLVADVVPVSISQQVSVSGSALACDPLCQEHFFISDPGQNFSFAKTNILLPPTNHDVSGSATDTVGSGLNDRTASVSADASQSAVSTANNIQVNLGTDDLLSSNITLVIGSVDASSQYSFTFNLPSAYLLHITGSITGGRTNEAFAPVPPFGTFDGEIHLTGPGSPFDQVLSSDISNSFFFQPVDATLALGPGSYTLEAVSGFTDQESYFLGSYSGIDVSLTADFTAVPEPAWPSSMLGVFLVGGICARRRWSCLTPARNSPTLSRGQAARLYPQITRAEGCHGSASDSRSVVR